MKSTFPFKPESFVLQKQKEICLAKTKQKKKLTSNNKNNNKQI